MNKSEYKEYWHNNNNLDFLLDESGVSLEALSERTRIGYESLRHYAANKVAPPMEIVISLADYFDVSVDFILGRLEYDTIPGYHGHFTTIMRERHEELLSAVRPEKIEQFDFISKDMYESPWPYNILEKLISRPLDFIVTYDIEKGLIYTIENDLTERESVALLRYYRDGKNLEEVAKEFGVSRERIRQVIAKALRKLRYPVRLRTIIYGYEGNRALEQRKIELDEREREINKKSCDLAKLMAVCGAHDECKLAQSIIIEKSTQKMLTTIDEMDLSVRSYNCLKRRGVETISEIIDLFESGDIVKIRNLGRKSAEEISNKVYEITGVRYTA